MMRHASTQPNASEQRLEDVEVAVVRAGVIASTEAEPADAVFRLHYAPLAGWCRRMTGDEDVAHDVAAEAFVRLLARWTTVTDPRAYLYTTALNLIRDRWRRGEREKVALRKIGTTVETGPPPQPELRMLVESLPRRLQQVVVLHYFADLTVEAVGQALGIASGTVKRDLYDARAKLAALLEAS